MEQTVLRSHNLERLSSPWSSRPVYHPGLGWYRNDPNLNNSSEHNSRRLVVEALWPALPFCMYGGSYLSAWPLGPGIIAHLQASWTCMGPGGLSLWILPLHSVTHLGFKTVEFMTAVLSFQGSARWVGAAPCYGFYVRLLYFYTHSLQLFVC